jgi:hypothetical protein
MDSSFLGDTCIQTVLQKTAHATTWLLMTQMKKIYRKRNGSNAITIRKKNSNRINKKNYRLPFEK